MFLVRTPQDLVELPYSFMQLRALMPQQFIAAAQERGVYLTEDLLEFFHRHRLLVPLLRVRRDVRLIARLVKQRDVRARQVAHWHPTSREDLVDARAEGRLFDPDTERFMSR